MKAFGLIGLLIVASCGKLTTTDPSGITRDGSQQAATPEEKADVSMVCDLLNTMESNYRTTYNDITKKFNFTTKLENCGEPAVTFTVKATVDVNTRTGVMNFDRADRSSYFIARPEGKSVGEMSVLCANLNDLKQPVIVNQTAYYFEVVKNNDCVSANNNRHCLRMITSAVQTNGTHKDKFMNAYSVSKVDIGGQFLRGMVTQQFRVENAEFAGCADSSKELKGESTFINITPN